MKIKYAIHDRDTGLYVTSMQRENVEQLLTGKEFKELELRTTFFTIDGACLMFDNYRLVQTVVTALNRYNIKAEMVSYMVSI